MTKCGNCGQDNPIGSKYCSDCGSPIPVTEIHSNTSNRLTMANGVKENSNLHKDTRAGWAAFLLSFIVFPGVGETYTRAYKTGILFFTIMIAFLFLCSIGILQIDPVWIMIIGGIICIISAFNAYFKVLDYNCSRHPYMSSDEQLLATFITISGITINFTYMLGIVGIAIILFVVITSEVSGKRKTIVYSLTGSLIGLLFGSVLNSLFQSYFLSLF